ncbi:MAG TPA: hypothetical protein VMQ67_08835 [Candidatus Saccharimonadales bacterium]|nr:hypothetical protein [Candidatus Saccharimonadales bacterium]
MTDDKRTFFHEARQLAIAAAIKISAQWQVGAVASEEGNGLSAEVAGSSWFMALWNSFVTPDEAFLNSLIPWPTPFANSGILLAPNKIKTAARTISSSLPPICA